MDAGGDRNRYVALADLVMHDAVLNVDVWLELPEQLELVGGVNRGECNRRHRADDGADAGRDVRRQTQPLIAKPRQANRNSNGNRDRSKPIPKTSNTRRLSLKMLAIPIQICS